QVHVGLYSLVGINLDGHIELQRYGLRVSDRFPDRTGPEGHNGNASASLVLVVVQHRLQRVSASVLCFQLNTVVLPPRFARTVKGPHGIGSRTWVGKGSIQEMSLCNNLANRDLQVP